MRRPFPALFLTLAIAACGGKLADDENVSTVVPGTATRDAGTSSTTTDIAHLPGLVLWLDAAKGVVVDGGRVIDWLDQSPEHNNLALYVGQGAVSVAGIAGLPTLAFGGDSAYAIPFDTALDDWSGDFLVEVVVHADSAPTSLEAVLSCSGTPPNVPGFTRATFYLADDQTSECTVDSDGYSNESKTKPMTGDPVVIGYRRSGTTLEARQNGSVDRSDQVERVTAPSCAKTVFAANLTEDMQQEENFLASQIAEVVVVHGPLSVDQVYAVERSLMAKYAIP